MRAISVCAVIYVGGLACSTDWFGMYQYSVYTSIYNIASFFLVFFICFGVPLWRGGERSWLSFVWTVRVQPPLLLSLSVMMGDFGGVCDDDDYKFESKWERVRSSWMGG